MALASEGLVIAPLAALLAALALELVPEAGETDRPLVTHAAALWRSCVR